MKKINLTVIVLCISISCIMSQGLKNFGAHVKVTENTVMNIDDNGNFVTSGGGFSLNGTMTVDGDAETDNQFIIGPSGSFINYGDAKGSCRVKRAISGNVSHFISSPVGNELVNIFSGAFVYHYDEPGSAWESMSSGNSLEDMKGYSVLFFDDTEIEFSGSLQSGRISFNASDQGGGFNLVGNPYPSAVDWSKTGWTKTNIASTIAFWNGENYSYQRQGTSWKPDVEGSTENATSIIPAAQGFFIKSEGTGTLSVSNSARVHETQKYYKSGQKPILSYIRLEASGNGRTDYTIVTFEENATEGYELSLDGAKLFSPHNLVPQIYSFAENKSEKLAINAMPVLTGSKTIPLGFRANTGSQWIIGLNEENYVLHDIILEDKVNNEFTDLKKARYSFTSSAGDFTNRFLLHISQVSTGTQFNLPGVGAQIRVYSAQSSVYVSFSESLSLTKQICIFDVSGRKVYDDKVSFTGIKKLPANLKSGCYLVHVRSGMYRKQKRW